MLMLMAIRLAKTPSQGHRSRTSLQSRTRGPNRLDASLDSPSFSAEVHSRSTCDLLDDATLLDHLSENRDPLGADGPQVQVATADKWAIRHGLTYSVVSRNSSEVGTWDGHPTTSGLHKISKTSLANFAGSKRQTGARSMATTTSGRSSLLPSWLPAHAHLLFTRQASKSRLHFQREMCPNILQGRQ